MLFSGITCPHAVEENRRLLLFEGICSVSAVGMSKLSWDPRWRKISSELLEVL